MSGFKCQNPANVEQKEGEPSQNDSVAVTRGRGGWCEGARPMTSHLHSAANEHTGPDRDPWVPM